MDGSAVAALLHSDMLPTICNLCGADDYTVIFRNLPDLLLGTNVYRATLVRCRQCGLVYQNPRPEPAELKAAYSAQYEPYGTSDKFGNAPPLLRAAYAFGISKRARYVTARKQNGRLLDIGCATGLFLNSFRQNRQWDLFGVEPDEQSAEYARHGYQLNVQTGTLEEAGFSDGFFDAVTMWDVLEHVPDAAGTLREIRRILKPDGVLVIRVPNGASLDAHMFGRYWAGLEAPRHLYVFDKRTLAALLKAEGFNVISNSYHSGGYTTFVLSLRFWLHRDSKPAQKHPLKIEKFLDSPAMRLAAAPFFYLLAAFGLGPLMVTTAVKEVR